MAEEGGHNIAELSYSATIELLHKEGYQLNDSHGQGNFVMIMVHSAEEADVEFYKEAGYSLFQYESEQDLRENADVVHCGGIYTCAAIYNGETNITDDDHLDTFLPAGDTVVVEEEEEEEEDDERYAPRQAKRQRRNDDSEEDDEDYDDDDDDDEDNDDDDYEDEDD